MTPPSKCSGPDVRGSGLPLDALYEILLRLPAKELCRLRAVCRPWRSLLSDQQFIAAHAARHPGPLIIASNDPHGRDRRSRFLFEVMDLSGQVVKRFQKIQDWGVTQFVMPSLLDVVCVQKAYTSSCLLLDPATRAVFTLPEEYAEQHSLEERELCRLSHIVVLGQVASTGQYKALRVTENKSKSSIYINEQLCEVFTFDGSRNARWREKEACPVRVSFAYRSRVVIKGIVHFLLRDHTPDEDAWPVYCILSFDLGTEDWRPIIRGPLSYSDSICSQISVTCLNDCLVMVNCTDESYMDLWFLMDFENGLWVKQHSIEFQLSFGPGDIFRYVHPFMVLNDGRIFTYIESKGLLRIYDPRNRTYTDVAEIGFRGEVGLYTGNLLSLVSNAI